MRGWWVGLGVVWLVAMAFLAVDWSVSVAVVSGAAAGTGALLAGRLPGARRVVATAALATAIVLGAATSSAVVVVVSERAITTPSWVLTLPIAIIVLVSAVMVTGLVATGRRVRSVGWLGRVLVTGPLVAAAAMVGLLVGTGILLVGRLATIGGPPPPPIVFTGYTLEVRPSPPDSGGAFDVVVRATYDAGVTSPLHRQVTLGTRRVTSSAAGGLVIRQAVLPGPDAFPPVAVPESAGKAVGLCEWTCPPVTVEFVDFPRGSVWQVRDGTIDRREPFGATELVLASITPVDGGGGDVAFSYLPVPFNSLPQPAIGLAQDTSDAPKLLVAAIVALVVAASRAAVAALRSAAARRIGELLGRWRRRRQHEPVTRKPDPPSVPARRQRPTGRPPRR